MNYLQISSAIETNFSGIYAEKVVKKMLKKACKKNEKHSGRGRQGHSNENRSEENANGRGLESKPQKYKLRTADEIGKRNSENKAKFKSMSERIFKNLYLELLQKEFEAEEAEGAQQKVKRLSSRSKRDFAKSKSILGLIKKNLEQNEGRHLMLFHDSVLTQKMLFQTIKK